MLVDDGLCSVSEVARCSRAMFSPAFPVNPRPFARAIDAGVDRCGSDWIRSDEGKRVLWVLIAMAYGQLAIVDLCDEWRRLGGGS